MLKGIEAVIFDMDGTLIDSMALWEEIDIKYLEKHQIKPPAILKENQGMSFTETAIFFKDYFKLPYTVEEIKEEWTQMATDFYLNEVKLKEKAEEFIDKLLAQNLKLGIASSNAKDLIEIAMKSVGLDKKIHAYRSACEVEKGKPAPDVYLKVAEDLGVDPKKCIVFEDVPNGILAGKNAGMRTVAIYDYYSRNEEDKKRKLADYYIETYAQLL